MDAFGSFIRAAESVCGQERDPAGVVAVIEPLPRTLVTQPGWLKEQYRRAIPSTAYAQYLLYRPPDHSFSVVSFVWNPGQGSPIHDHCTWGVIGQYEGEEEESRFRHARNRLELIGVMRAREM